MSNTPQEVQDLTRAWRENRELRLLAEKEAAEFGKREAAAKSRLLQALQDNPMDGVVVDGRAVTVTSKIIPIVEDRAALERYILENECLALLQFRLSTATVQEMRENGEEIPGIGDFTKYDLSDKKL